MDERTLVTPQEAARKKRMKVAVGVIFIVVPILLVLSMIFGDGQWYLLFSFFILIAIMAPFFMVFEKRKPKAREIVLIAVMSAITVVVHLFFHIVIPLQVGTAVVIIAGISLGPEAGFLIGALSRFVCNFYMGQGAWTPWQMFCWGILGFLAGMAFNKGNVEKLNSDTFKAIIGPIMTVIFAELIGYVSYVLVPGSDGSFFSWRVYAFGAAGLLIGFLLQRKRMPIDTATLVIFTFFTTFVVYGGIINFAAMVTSQNMAGAEAMSDTSLAALYISGLPYDLVHAASAAVCILFLGKPMIKKLERIKIKYGIYK